MAVPSKALKNPIWEALNTQQNSLALGNEHAKRFPADISPLAGLREHSLEAYKSLADISAPEEQLALFLADPPLALPYWSIETHTMLMQLVYSGGLLPESLLGIQTLGKTDVPDMVALTALTKPGPFEQRTHELGTYTGIHKGNMLVAMAGERLHLPGATEISAVCTHPDFQGKGYAKLLVMAMINRILRRGDRPFLHARTDNAAAIRVYEKLGFKQQNLFHLVVLKRV